MSAARRAEFTLSTRSGNLQSAISAFRKRPSSGYESFGREKLEFLQLPTSKRCEGSVEKVADVYEHRLAFLGHANELWDGYLTNVSQAAVASIP